MYFTQYYKQFFFAGHCWVRKVRGNEQDLLQRCQSSNCVLWL